MVSSIQHTIFESIDRHLSHYLDIWKYIHTQRYTSQTQNIQDIQATLASLCRKYGLVTRYLDEQHSVLYAESTDTTSTTLLFYAPYTANASIFSGLLPLIAGLAALHTYQTSIGTPPLQVKWLIEEIPEHAYVSQLENIVDTHRTLLQADGCFFYTTQTELDMVVPVPQLILGTKGLLSAELKVQTAHMPVPARYGAIVPNAAWQLIWSLNSIKDAREDILIEGFYDAILPPSDDALTSLSSIATEEDTSNTLQQWGIQELVTGLHGIQQQYAYFLTPACTITELQSMSDAPTIPASSNTSAPTPPAQTDAFIPAQARAQLDMHLVPEQDPYALFSMLQQHLSKHGHHTVQTRLLKAQSPAMTSAKEKLVAVSKQTFQIAYNHAPTLIPLGTQLPAFTTLQKLRPQQPLPTIGIALPALIKNPQVNKSEQFATEFSRQIKQQALLFACIQENHMETAE